MTPERWEAVKRLFNDALEREPSERAGYLVEAAKTDPALAEEVRALLSGQGRADEAFGALTRTGGLKTLAPGTRLGPYEIVSLIGAGGMGEVYKASDTRLDRRVAIKVLPSELASDPERLKRLEREARTISRLNHPHVCALYDVGEQDGLSFLVMEYLEGGTLADRLGKGPLPLPEALQCATEIARALAEAHRRGIVHRDLKPANVMLTAGGAKLLDFGIAKLYQERAAAESAATGTADSLTGEGQIVGTPQYMSPEQLKGEPVDAATDVFAFGVVLYEMVTGRKAFEAPSRAGLIAAILERHPPPLSQAQPGAPAELETIVRRCLEKDPRGRYGHGDELLAALARLAAGAVASGGILAPVAGRPIVATRPWLLATGALLLGLGAAALLVLRRGDHAAGPPPPFGATFTQLTSHTGLEFHPSLSPDGRWIVYAGNASGNWDVYLQGVGGQMPINLTADSTAADTQPAFSPDGERIAFRSERQVGGIFVMGRTGESVRRLTEGGYNPSWSPDGNEVVFATNGIRDDGPYGTSAASSQLLTANLATGETRRISKVTGLQPRWSPNGNRVAYWTSWTTDRNLGQLDIWTIPAGGGEPVPVTNDAAVDWNPVWSPDGRYLYFASDRSGSMNLCRVPIDERSGKTVGEVEPLTTPSSFVAHLSFAADGRRAAYSSIVQRLNLQRVAFDAAAERLVGDPIWVTSGSKSWWFPNPSPDGEWVGFSSFFGQEDIYVTRSDGSNLRQLTNDRANDRFPRWSPDGKRIAFASNRSGEYQIWIIDADGSGLRQLTRAKEGLVYPVWAPDGSRLSAIGRRPELETWIFDPNTPWSGQTPQRLSPLRDKAPRFAAWSWSPDGQRLAGQDESDSRGMSGTGIIVYSLASQAYTRLTDFGHYPVWLNDSRRLLFSSKRKLYLLDSGSRRIRELMSLTDEDPSAPAVTADNRWVHFHRQRTEADIWMATLKR